MNSSTLTSCKAWTGALTLAGALAATTPAYAASSASSFFDVLLSVVGYRDAASNPLMDKPAALDIGYGLDNDGDRQGTGMADALSDSSASVFFGTLELSASADAWAYDGAFAEASANGNASGTIFLSNSSATDGYWVDFEGFYNAGGSAYADFGGESAWAQVLLEASGLSGLLFDFSQVVNSSDSFGDANVFEFSVFIAANSYDEVLLTGTSSAYAVSNVPVPAALPLLGSALVVLGGVIRRRVVS